MTKNELEIMGVYELRRLARNFGVVSPTSKKKAQLIEEIEKIKRGEIKPKFSKKGRPPLLGGLRHFSLSTPKQTQVEIDLYVKEYDAFVKIFDRLIKLNYNDLIKEVETGRYEIKHKDQSINILIKDYS